MSVFAALGLAGILVAATTGVTLAQSRTFDVAPFSGVDISTGLDADVSVGGGFTVIAEARDPTYLSDLKVEVRDGQLVAWVDGNIVSFNDRNRIMLRITAPMLDSARSNSGAEVKARGVSGDKLAVEADGGSKIDVLELKVTNVTAKASAGSDLHLTGSCSTAVFEANSGADLKASELRCEDVTVTASGGSDAEVFASSSVTATATSGSNVDVHGSPRTVSQNANSGGEVEIE